MSKLLKTIEGSYIYTHKKGGLREVIVSLEEHDEGLMLILDVWKKEESKLGGEEIIKTITINLDENS